MSELFPEDEDLTPYLRPPSPDLSSDSDSSSFSQSENSDVVTAPRNDDDKGRHDVGLLFTHTTSLPAGDSVVNEEANDESEDDVREEDASEEADSKEGDSEEESEERSEEEEGVSRREGEVMESLSALESESGEEISEPLTRDDRTTSAASPQPLSSPVTSRSRDFESSMSTFRAEVGRTSDRQIRHINRMVYDDDVEGEDSCSHKHTDLWPQDTITHDRDADVPSRDVHVRPHTAPEGSQKGGKPERKDQNGEERRRDDRRGEDIFKKLIPKQGYLPASGKVSDAMKERMLLAARNFAPVEVRGIKVVDTLPSRVLKPEGEQPHLTQAGTRVKQERVDDDRMRDAVKGAGEGSSETKGVDAASYRVDDLPKRWPGEVKKLYPEVLDAEGNGLKVMAHQVHGVKWLLDLYANRSGGILADDMGLGKTVQACLAMKLLIEHKGDMKGSMAQEDTAKRDTDERPQKLRKFLILAPKSVLGQWENHVKWICPYTVCYTFHGASKESIAWKFRLRTNDKHQVLLTTYDTFRGGVGDMSFARPGDDRSKWDLWIADEATACKNPSSLSFRAAREVGARCKIMMTGTPIMNNYHELWALMDLAVPDLLFTRTEFTMRYMPLLDKHWRGNEDIRRELIADLRGRVQRHILRRTKKEIFDPSSSSSPPSNDVESTEKPKLPEKTDVIIFQELAPLQYEAHTFRKYLQTWREDLKNAEIENIPSNTSSPVSTMAGKFQEEEEEESKWFDNERLELSKYEALYQILPSLIAQNHAIVLFSKNTSTPLRLDWRRIDGSVSLKKRQKRLDEFAEPDGPPLMLITTRAGGLGLTLTRADRVIILDPSWNPALDNQAVDRAHRIGQKRNVTVYRFVSGGTIEDNMLRLQLLKLNMSSSILAGVPTKQWLTKTDLRSLFKVTLASESETRTLLQDQALAADIIPTISELGDEPLISLNAIGAFSMGVLRQKIEQKKAAKRETKLELAAPT